MSNPPAFPLYAADFYMDTVDWECEEIGLYLRLLLIEWINGPLPSDHKRLIKLVKTHHKTFNKAWVRVGKKFINNGQGLINERLEQEREKQIIWREKSKLGGIRSGEIRRRVVERVVEAPYEPPYQPNGQPKGNSSSSSSSSLEYSLRKEPFKLPTSEEINESSKRKLKKDINEISEYLYQEKIFLQAHAFKDKMLKEKKSERAILHTLVRCAIKKEFLQGSWAYCMKIMQVEDGNYNEYEYRKDKS